MRRILVVEDNATVRNTVVRALESEYEVITANDGLMGWLKATAEPRPDLIIADVEMPRLDGIGMLKRVRAAGATEVPVILLTSHDQPCDVVYGMRAGARHYLTKPFHVNDLKAKVRKLLPP
jgi:DNA-binding response OmpR family regulator